MNIASFSNWLQGSRPNQTFHNPTPPYQHKNWTPLHLLIHSALPSSLCLSSQPPKALICSQCCSMSLAMHWALLTPRPATQWWGHITRVLLGTLSTTAWDPKIWSTSPSSMVDRPFSHLCIRSLNVNMFFSSHDEWSCLPGGIYMHIYCM